jgi:hypothetical protein
VHLQPPERTPTRRTNSTSPREPFNCFSCLIALSVSLMTPSVEISSSAFFCFTEDVSTLPIAPERAGPSHCSFSEDAASADIRDFFKWPFEMLGKVETLVLEATKFLLYVNLFKLIKPFCHENALAVVIARHKATSRRMFVIFTPFRPACGRARLCRQSLGRIERNDKVEIRWPGLISLQSASLAGMRP